MNNLSSYCGLVDAKIRVSDKDLPVPSYLLYKKVFWALDEYFSIAKTLLSLNVKLNFKENR